MFNILSRMEWGISGKSEAPFLVSSGRAFALTSKPVPCLRSFERIGERNDNDATETKMNIVFTLIFFGTFFKLPILRTVLSLKYNWGSSYSHLRNSNGLMT